MATNSHMYFLAAARRPQPGAGQRIRLILLAALIGLCPSLALANDAPINIQADQADIKKDLSTYSGDVRITQGSISLSGDILTVKRLGKNAQGDQEFLLSLRGHPATIKQAATRQYPEAIQGQANHLSYRSTSRTITLTGNAMLQRGSEIITGDTIKYDRQARRMLVNHGVSGGRISITLDPDGLK